MKATGSSQANVSASQEPGTMHHVVSKYKLPLDVKYCTKCVISNQRPRINFDEHGVCSACNFAIRKQHVIDWDERERQLCDLLDRYRSKDGFHDVVVPCSGGKDSAFVAHQLKCKYGMHPLTVTWTPHIYTEVGWENLQSFIHVGGFDNILGTPNGKIHRVLTKLAFEHLGDPFQPFIYGQRSFPMRIAVKFNIPLIMYGEDGEVEYGGEPKDARSVLGAGEELLRHAYSGVNVLEWAKHGIPEKDLYYYLPPSPEEFRRVGAEMRFFGYHKKWVPQENYYYAMENTGFRANPDGRSEGTYSKYAGLDDRIDGFHYYMAYVKFGIGRATSDAAHEIRDGHITRDEGVALVRRYDGEFPQKYFREFLEYADISEQRFRQIVDSFRPPHLWKQVGGEWKLKHQVS